MTKKTKTTTTSHNRLGEGERNDLSERARYACYWIEKHLWVSTEARLRLCPFQVKFIRDFHAGDDKREIRRAVLSTGRKMGKTTLAAALQLHHLSAPGAPEYSQNFTCSAASKDQSFLAFDAMVGFIERNPKLRERWSVNPAMRQMTHRGTMSMVQALSTNVRGLQGRLAETAIFDELSQARSLDLLDTIEKSQNKNRQWLIVTSTLSQYAGNPLAEIIDMCRRGHAEGVLKEWLLRLYAAPPDAKWWDDDALRAANPGLEGDPPLVEWDLLLEEREQARLNAEKRRHFRVYRLNQEAGNKAPLCDIAKWAEMGVSDDEREVIEAGLDGEECTVGIDLSEVTDLTSCALWFENPKYLKTMSWLPRGRLNDAERTDRIPYSEHIESGWMRACDGNAIEYRDIADYLYDVFTKYKVKAVHFDPWKMPALKESLRAVGLDYDGDGAKETWKPVIQGYKSFTPIINKWIGLVENKGFRHENNPILNMAVNATQIVSPPDVVSSSKKPTKASTASRIDACVASLMAVGYVPELEEPKKKAYNFDRFFETLRGA